MPVPNSEQCPRQFHLQGWNNLTCYVIRIQSKNQAVLFGLSSVCVCVRTLGYCPQTNLAWCRVTDLGSPQEKSWKAENDLKHSSEASTHWIHQWVHSYPKYTKQKLIDNKIVWNFTLVVTNASRAQKRTWKPSNLVSHVLLTLKLLFTLHACICVVWFTL